MEQVAVEQTKLDELGETRAKWVAKERQRLSALAQEYQMWVDACINGTFGSDPRVPKDVLSQECLRIKVWRKKLQQNLKRSVEGIQSEFTYMRPGPHPFLEHDRLASRSFDAWKTLEQQVGLDSSPRSTQVRSAIR